jgi:hypothetical protein
MTASSSLSASTTRAIARSRRLCCLGLGGQKAVPALLGKLHALIPSSNHYFIWAGRPVCELQNPWGAFTFRAYWFDRGAGPGAPPLIGITVERLEPLALKLCAVPRSCR